MLVSAVLKKTSDKERERVSAVVVRKRFLKNQFLYQKKGQRLQKKVRGLVIILKLISG